MVYSLVYVSRTAAPLSRRDLLELRTWSRTFNSSVDITGLLLHREGGFLQMLEGRRVDVEALYASIERDTRHREVTLVRTQEQRDREFPGWSMAFGAVDEEPFAVEVTPGSVDPGPTQAEAAFVRELLGIFDTRA